MAHHSSYNEFSSIQGFSNNHHEFFGAQASGIEILKQQISFFLDPSSKSFPAPLPEMTMSAGSHRWPEATAVAAAHLQQAPQLVMQDHGMGNFHGRLQQTLHLMNSKFLVPAQELLTELCSLGVDESSFKKRLNKTSLEAEGKDSSLFSNMELLELQKIKAKLLSMLEEVDRRYRNYCEQMRIVVASFEAVAGEEAARVYSALASKAMSRHFRCLRDGVAGQLRAARKAMGEKGDSAATTSTRSETTTPRLKLLEQRIRQHKAFQQGFMEQPPWRPQRGLPERSVSGLRDWLFEHFLHPYPSDVDKHILARQTGLSRSQVSNWFINARVRLWKPMVEEMYLQEMKELSNNEGNQTVAGADEEEDNDNPNCSNLSFDQKPPSMPAVQLLADSDSLSSIINISHDRIGTTTSIKSSHQHQSRNENFGVIDDLDHFSYGNNIDSRSGVSLTLGLQQHNGGGVGLSLLPDSSLFPREGAVHDHDEQQVLQFSILDGEGDQNLPSYRNMMGADELLHDFSR
ncbi:hypothetical protein Cni_G27053 [Canna indica]|uniref:Homeobox domain-containing protein n=1 Tax=Canna indica TaxID=4628 RepID=A0AAQ3L0X6_9LILI|nr:hypothetical protein Cni_G27053 [Canna indica]